jgi:sugar/nucleoside kinase (ribokinase family)
MTIPPSDYLTIGHLTKDLAGTSYTLGGTAAYASKTALSFGLKAALISAHSTKIDLEKLNGIEIIRKSSAKETTFENIETPNGRIQILHETAQRITAQDISDDLIHTPIIHIGPVANEVDEEVVSVFDEECLVGITPQGWMRHRSNDGKVAYQSWLPTQLAAQRADAVVISDEDIEKDESVINDYAQMFKLLVVTEGFNGARVYWHGDVRHFSAPLIDTIDATGAGDIFAAAFFIRLKTTNDPWESAEAAVRLASLSVTRKGLDGIPRPEEVQSRLMDIIKGSSSQPRRGASL